MNNNNDDGGSVIFLGLVMFGFFLWMLSKIATVVFIEIGRMFEAFGKAATSFFGMAWAITQLAGIVGFGILLIYAVYKFMLLIKNSTAIMEQFEARASEFMARLQVEHDKTERHLNRMVYQMREELSEALKEPEAVPPAAQESAAADTPIGTENPFVVKTPKETAEQQPIDSNQPSVSVLNPY